MVGVNSDKDDVRAGLFTCGYARLCATACSTRERSDSVWLAGNVEAPRLCLMALIRSQPDLEDVGVV